MSKNTVNKRFKKNAISLKGQIVAFGIRINFWSVLLISKAFEVNLTPSFIISCGIFTNAISNIALFVASAEIRREYFGDDNTWIPKFFKR